jgi:hypothetical protein
MVINCVNCDSEFFTSPFESVPFCSLSCRHMARTVRWLRLQVSRYGTIDAWPPSVIQETVARVPDEATTGEFGERWNAPTPLRACDEDSWHFTWQEWVVVDRRRSVSIG